MKYKLTAFLLPLILIATSGCAGDSDEDLKIYGTWEFQDLYESGFTTFEKGMVTNYIYIDLYSCYQIITREIEDISNNSILLAYDNSESHWSIANDILSITSEYNGHRELAKSNVNIDSLISCDNLTQPGNIEINVSFKSLPETIKVSHESTIIGMKDYYLQIVFDINKNNRTDIGDIILTIGHAKWSNFDSKDLDLQFLDSDIHVIISQNERGENIVKGVGYVNYSIIDNTFNISLDKSNSVALAGITLDVSLFVSSFYIDEQNLAQSDRYPDSEFTSGTSLIDMQDNTDDILIFTLPDGLPSNEAVENIIVDIEKISIIISD